MIRSIGIATRWRRAAKVKGTAGAGDTFSATVCAGLIEGREPAEALRRATLNAGAVVSTIDAHSGQLALDMLDDAASRAKDEPRVARIR